MDSQLSYRKIALQTRAEGWYRSLSGPRPNARSLFDFLVASGWDQSIPGLFVCSLGQVAHELGWEASDVERTWQEISDAGVGVADWQAGVVWIPRCFMVNLPSERRIRTWRWSFPLVPECSIKRAAYRHAMDYCQEQGASHVRALEEVGQLCLPLVARPAPPPETEGYEPANRTPSQEAVAEEAAGEAFDGSNQEEASTQDSDRPGQEGGTQVASEPSDPELVGDGPGGGWVFRCRAARGGAPTWMVGPEELAQFRQAFPELDLPSSLNRAQNWCRCNPRRRKTARHMMRFLHGWLERDRVQAQRRKAWRPQPGFQPRASNVYADQQSKARAVLANEAEQRLAESEAEAQRADRSVGAHYLSLIKSGLGGLPAQA